MDSSIFSGSVADTLVIKDKEIPKQKKTIKVLLECSSYKYLLYNYITYINL